MPLVDQARPRRSPLAGAVTAAQASLLVRGDAHPFAQAAHANVWIIEGDALVTPPLDGRLLPGTERARLLAAPPDRFERREEPIPLERLEAAADILLSSALRGLHVGIRPGQPPRFATGTALRAAGAAGPLAEAVVS